MLQNISVTEPQFLEWIKAFSVNHLRALEASNPGSEDFPHQEIRAGFQAGLFQLPAPHHLGGKELDVVSLAWVIRTLSKSSASYAASFIGNLLGLSAVMLYGEESLKERILNSANLNQLWSFGMTEAEAGSDLLNIKTTARRTATGFELNGEKNFITNANYSANMAIFAKELNEAGEFMGISCFYVSGNVQGLSRGPAFHKTAWKRANTGSLIFNNVQLSGDARLGKVGDGLRILTHCLNRSKTLLSAMGVGIADRAMELVIERLGSTERFGKALIEQPAIRHLIAKSSIQRDAAWMMCLRAAATWDAGLDATMESSQAKHFSGEVAAKISADAIELFGARGLFQEFEVSRLWSEAKAIQIIEGPSLVQELLIARALLPIKNKKKPELYALKEEDLKKVGS